MRGRPAREAGQRVGGRQVIVALRSPRIRRRALAGAALAVLLAAVAVVVADPFGGAAASGGGVDNGSPTSTTTIVRRDLSSQTQVGATLGYADASTISVPAGTAPTNVRQAQQSAAAAAATLADDARALDQARAALDADRRKLAVDCRGANAAEAAAPSSGGSAGPCATDAQSVATDEQNVTSGTSKVHSDERAVAAANDALAEAQSSAAAYGQASVYTLLPAVGDVVRRGGTLYAIGGQPAVLLYGRVPAWRAFAPGMSPGRDVAELNANLRALGYGNPSGSAFTADTSAAIEAFQAARGLARTGVLLLGSVAFEPGAVRVTSVTPTAGAAVQAGPVLSVTSTRRVVTIALDASQQASVKVGDPVEITLPDNSTTPGRVSYVGTVATTPSGDQGSSTPTIEVDVTPDHPGATGRLDQASVDVSITTDTVRNVLVAPVNALLALAGGGYAVEVVDAAGTRRLVAVTTGLFDDADGLVQVSGSLQAGARIVVPAS
jgi:peptidoglycan hydrolase-like protein with peptidoglycan-binding domain